jgi:serine/threonine-protein kinase
MELLDGVRMPDARDGPLSVGDALDLVLPVAAAVAAAHDAGVIHRDLKPSNICVTRGPGSKPWPKVVDFGVSKVILSESQDHNTASDAVVGTTAYMAPEQARAARNASFKSDQYSLAALLYQCVTGELPFSGRGVYELVESIMSRPLAAPGTRVEGIPPALDTAVLRAMSRDPLERFPSVRSFGAALLPLASEHARLALEAELRAPADGTSDEGTSTVSRDVDDDAPSASSPDHPRDALQTMHASRSLHPASSPTMERATWIVGVGLAALVAVGAAAAWRMASHGTPASVATTHTSDPPADPPRSAPPERPEPVSEPPRAVEAVPAVAPSASPPAAPISVPVAHPHAPSHRRSPSPPAAMAVGDNGAPILP